MTARIGARHPEHGFPRKERPALGLPPTRLLPAPHVSVRKTNFAQRYSHAFSKAYRNGGLVMCHPGFVDAALESLDSLTTLREQEFAFSDSNTFLDILAFARCRIGAALLAKAAGLPRSTGSVFRPREKRDDAAGTPTGNRPVRPPGDAGRHAARRRCRAHDCRRPAARAQRAYALVQTALVQDEALKRADARIRELSGEDAAPRRPAADFSTPCAMPWADAKKKKFGAERVRSGAPGPDSRWNTGGALPPQARKRWLLPRRRRSRSRRRIVSRHRGRICRRCNRRRHVVQLDWLAVRRSSRRQRLRRYGSRLRVRHGTIIIPAAICRATPASTMSATTAAPVCSTTRSDDNNVDLADSGGDYGDFGAMAAATLKPFSCA